MKIKDSFIVHDFEETVVLVPTAKTDFHGLGQGGETVSVILHCLTEDTTEDKIVDELAKRYTGSREIMAEDVHSVICKLRTIDALDE